MVQEGGLPVEQGERYDIRGFLSWDGVDTARYAKLRKQGMVHHQIMRTLHTEREDTK